MAEGLNIINRGVPIKGSKYDLCGWIRKDVVDYDMECDTESCLTESCCDTESTCEPEPEPTYIPECKKTKSNNCCPKLENRTLLNFSGTIDPVQILPAVQYLIGWGQHSQASNTIINGNQILISGTEQQIIKNMWIATKFTEQIPTTMHVRVFIIPASNSSMIQNTNLVIVNNGQTTSNNLQNCQIVNPGDQVGIQVELLSGAVPLFVTVSLELFNVSY